MLASLAFWLEILLRKILSGLFGENFDQILHLHSKAELSLNLSERKWMGKWISQKEKQNNLPDRKMNSTSDVNTMKTLKMEKEQMSSRRSFRRASRKTGAWEQLSLSADQSTRAQGRARRPIRTHGGRTYGKEINIRQAKCSLRSHFA